MKLRIKISKYCSWYLCQISLQIMLLPIPIRSRCWIWIHTSRGCPVGVCLKLYFMLARRFLRKSSCSLFLRAMNLAVVFKCYSITNNYGLNKKFSSYSWDAIINRKKKTLISSSGSYNTRWDKRKFYLAFLQNSFLLKLLNFSLQVTSVKKVRS